MKSCKLYHNSLCSKSRQVLTLLTDNGIQPEIVDYIKEPLTPSQVFQLISLLGSSESIVRTNEKEFVDGPFDTTDPLIVADRISTQPKLMQRPIVVCGGRAVIGRPPEKILQWINSF